MRSSSCHMGANAVVALGVDTISCEGLEKGAHVVVALGVDTI